MIRLSLFLLSLSSLGLSACSAPLPAPEFFEEIKPLGNNRWLAIPELPAWARAGESLQWLPASASAPDGASATGGAVQAVLFAKSNVRGIAASGLGLPFGGRQWELHLAEHLAVAMSAVQVAALAKASLPDLQLMERACREEYLTLDAVPGNTLATAWGRYEIPWKDFLRAVPADQRDSVERYLVRPR